MSDGRESFWKRLGLLAGILAFLLIAFLPSGLHTVAGAGHRPAYAAAVAAMMAVWWFSEAISITVTALVPLVLFPIFGVFGRGPWGDALRSAEPFVDAYIFLFMGGMVLGAAMEQWGLHRRIALHIMRAIGTHPMQLLFGILAATAAVSMWISNTATAVMMMPIGLALIAQLEATHGTRLPHFGSAIMLAVAYASNVGGIGTKIGTGTNSIFCGYVSEKLNIDIGFLQYMALGTPFVLFFIPVVWLALRQVAKRDGLKAGHARELLDEELRAMGPMSSEEKKVAVVFAVAALCWIFGDPLRKVVAPPVSALFAGFKLQGKHYEATVAMLAAGILVVLGAVSFRALKRVPWGTLILLGGSFAMAAGIDGSGLSKWMAGELSALAGLPLFAQVFLTALATVALSAIASNTATVSVVLNILPQSMPVLSACAIGASCDFMLPAGTPPNAIVFGSGYIRLPTMMRTGFALDVAAVVFTSIWVYVISPFIFPQ